VQVPVATTVKGTCASAQINLSAPTARALAERVVSPAAAEALSSSSTGSPVSHYSRGTRAHEHDSSAAHRAEGHIIDTSTQSYAGVMLPVQTQAEQRWRSGFSSACVRNNLVWWRARSRIGHDQLIVGTAFAVVTSSYSTSGAGVSMAIETILPLSTLKRESGGS
jgi:hypothetical protein